MRFAVINGSPKGDDSITLAYVRLAEKKIAGHEFTVHNVAQRIGRLRKDDSEMEKIIEDMASADGVIWSFPLYYCLVSGQMMEFMELLVERAGDRLKEKHCAAISTSIHFFDHTAHEYVRAVSEDLGMGFVDFYSPAMMDLFDEKKQPLILTFFRDFFTSVERNAPTQRLYPEVTRSDFVYQTGAVAQKQSTGGKRVVVIGEVGDGDSNTGKMVQRFVDSFDGGVDVLDISKMEFSGCIGCCECSLDNVCKLQNSDEFHAKFESIRDADAVVFAGAVKLRNFSGRWQAFLNRTFYLGHTPIFLGKQGAALVSGPFSQLSTMQEVLTSDIGLMGTNNNGIVTDEVDNSVHLDRLIDDLAQRITEHIKSGYAKPELFPTYAGQKLFRDVIYANLRFPFVKDYQFYKAQGMFNFPKPSIQTRLMYLFAQTNFGVREIKKRFHNEMSKPVKDFLERV